MDMQSLFKQGECSLNVTTLLKHIQFADPGSPEIDEDNQGQSWGHYQFMVCGISPSSALTTWQDIGSVATAFKLVAATLKTCQDARAMCANAGTPKTSGYISNIYLEQVLECLEKCWVGTGGVCIHSILHFVLLISRPFLLLKPQPFLLHLPITTRQCRASQSKSSCSCPSLTILPLTILPLTIPPPTIPSLPCKTSLPSTSRPSPFQNPHHSCRSRQQYYNYMRCVGF